MQAGDRVMVYDSPGFPLNHYLYATVLTPSDAGALVIVDHPGNPSHGTQRFVPAKRILTADDAKKMADDTRAALKIERDGDKRKLLMDQIQNHEFVATQLAE
jgi:hypothetical protein